MPLMKHVKSSRLSQEEWQKDKQPFIEPVEDVPKITHSCGPAQGFFL